MVSGDLFTDLTLDALTRASVREEGGQPRPEAAVGKSRRRPDAGAEEKEAEEKEEENVPLETADSAHKVDSLA